MKLTIRTRHLDLTPELHDQLRRRVELALDRLAPFIRTVDVTLTDINGPKGGADKQCRLRIRGRSLPSVVIEHLGTDSLATVSAAADRAERAVLRAVSRRRAFTPLLSF